MCQNILPCQFFTYLSAAFKDEYNHPDVAKVSIKSEKITSFGGIFPVRELFSRYKGPIDEVLANRVSFEGYSLPSLLQMHDGICGNMLSSKHDG